MTHKNSRTENTKLNILIGFSVQFLTMLLSFVGRRLFMQFLSIEYLGINGLYTNILSLLSLAEFGLGSVVSFSLYKPVADDDQPLIRSLVRFFRKVYMIIAAGVGLVGIMLVPFLKYIVTSDLTESELIIYYLLFLINSISSYFVAHKIALLGAYQENRIQKIVSLASALLLQIIHICILLIYPNYIVYVVATIIGTLISNGILSIITDKKHKYIREHNEHPVPFEKDKIFTNIKSTAIYKFSTVVLNSIDNILITVMVSTAAVGLYSNYFVIISAVQMFVSIITSTLINGIGNLYTEFNKKRMLEIFKILVFIYHFISCFCAICMFMVLNDFISIWIGSVYIFDQYIVFAIAFNFYLTNLLTPIWSFREATGQFVNAKFIMLYAAILNVVLSVLFGHIFGTFGILIATAISKILTMVWYEPRILFKNVFQQSQKLYWLPQAKYVCCTIVASFLCYMLNRWFSSGMIDIIIKCVCSFVICLASFVIPNLKSNELVGVYLEMKRLFQRNQKIQYRCK